MFARRAINNRTVGVHEAVALDGGHVGDLLQLYCQAFRGDSILNEIVDRRNLETCIPVFRYPAGSPAVRVMIHLQPV